MSLCASAIVFAIDRLPMSHKRSSPDREGNALLAAGRLDESVAVGLRSVRANCTHMPTFRSLAIAQVLGGDVDAARQTMQRLLVARPGYSLQEFRTTYAGRSGVHASAYAEALRIAGLPER